MGTEGCGSGLARTAGALPMNDDLGCVGCWLGVELEASGAGAAFRGGFEGRFCLTPWRAGRQTDPWRELGSLESLGLRRTAGAPARDTMEWDFEAGFALQFRLAKHDLAEANVGKKGAIGSLAPSSAALANANPACELCVGEAGVGVRHEGAVPVELEVLVHEAAVAGVGDRFEEALEVLGL